MRVINLKTNRITNPLGFDLGRPRLSYVVTDTIAKQQVAARIEIALDNKFGKVVFDSGKSEKIDSLAFELPFQLQARTRYYWRVTVWADSGEVATSNIAWFETAKMDEPWTAGWIAPQLDPDIHPILGTEFVLTRPATAVVSARAYVCGVGLYEMNINGKKVGDEYLTPNINAYDKWLQYQTYDVAEYLQTGANLIEVALGNGIYKGRFSYRNLSNIYGDRFALLAEIHIEYEDGTSQVIGSNEHWTARRGKVQESGIYDGESYDATFADSTVYGVEALDLGYERVKARLSLPVKIKETLKPIAVINTPAGETVLDLGQNMVGWLEFKTKAPRGTAIKLQYGEILQDGNFYRENLRSAKAEYNYVADGEEAVVRPYFTFYGFRYVKVSGWFGEIDLNDFTGCVLYSDLEQTGWVETDNPLVNRLFLNALWGQKGNFLDVPTDCPQRDERKGWTGDAQVFAQTASFNMDSYAFFNKYLFDLWQEQKANQGSVYFYVPSLKANKDQAGACAWGDAATIIPWKVYVQYGDKAILEQQFPSMKAWVDYIHREDNKAGAKRLWTTGFHFGDWLALDGQEEDVRMGGTEIAFIASAYYSYSAQLVAKAARVLGKKELAVQYETLANEVKTAIQTEYFTPTGRLALKNQTAYVLALFMDLMPEGKRARLIEDFRELLEASGYRLTTGFVGTPLICRVLSDNGAHDLAYKLFLNEEYPGWLYAVKLGATTIWERWDSVLPDGSLGDASMNSLNHYAYGSVMEWVYRHVAGLNPVEERPGWRRVLLRPQPNHGLRKVKASYNSPVGLYASEWKISQAGNLDFKFTIPFNATALLTLPDAELKQVKLNGNFLSQTDLTARQKGKDVLIELSSGSWEFSYTPTTSYKDVFNTNSLISELLENEECHGVLQEELPILASPPTHILRKIRNMSLRQTVKVFAAEGAKETLGELDKRLRMIER